MSSNQESTDIRKAMAYDLLVILKENGDKTYTAEEIEKIIQAYISEQSK